MNNEKNVPIIIFLVVFFFFLLATLIGGVAKDIGISGNHTFKLLSSTENKDLENILQEFAKKEKFNLEITYAGTLEIMDKINSQNDYDAIWTSNSIWLYMLDNQSQIKDSVSTSINPVVFGIKKNKAIELGFVDKEIYTSDILQAIEMGNLKFLMSSATQTNTGASAYLGFLATLSGNKEVLSENDLDEENLKNDMIKLLSGVERSSGSDEFLSELIMKNDYDALVSYESSILQLNKELVSEGREALYLVYPVDGVSLSDSPLAYVSHDNAEKKHIFDSLQKYILSPEGQEKLAITGRRTWYGGVKSDVDESLFNKDWGVDTEKYIVPIKYPSTKVIKKALNMYQEELRKPISVVFLLDYSGSMYGKGQLELEKAMDFVLDYEKAKEDMVQFSFKDKITVIPFNQRPFGVYQAVNGKDTADLIHSIHRLDPMGQTNLYDSIIKGMEILNKESSEYNTVIILMTDGEGNVGTFNNLEKAYQNNQKEIPVYSIMFGDANVSQLETIASLTKGKVFDGKTDLLKAFKEVRGYN